MHILFNHLLEEAGLPLREVRLLRHANSTGRSAIDLWRRDRRAFLLYQSVQTFQRRPDFGDAHHWASFASTPAGETLFLGVYRVSFQGVGQKDLPKPHTSGVDAAGTYHRYKVAETHLLKELAGRLYIEWGRGTRSWIQRPDKQNKRITELRRSIDAPVFPGFLNFLEPLSRIESLPAGWSDVLRSSRGVYLLTCPRTGEHYVGKAHGEAGFLGRWLQYVATGHGGNIELKAREPSDYNISILEVAGSSASCDEISAMETRWKLKLRSRVNGLNRN